MFNLETLEEILLDHEKKQKNKKDIVTLNYDDYVLEQKENIIQHIKQYDSILINAPTGGGKTYSIIEIMKSFPNDLNIILTPNVIQNKQNAKEYNIQAFTGNDRNINSNCVSATYNKARKIIDHVKNNNCKVNLFIDECHLLIDSTNYRMKAIKDLLELVKLSNKVIYMSATNRYTRNLLDYQIELNIQPNEVINNIMASQILRLDKKNFEGALVHQIIEYSKVNGRKSVLFLDDIEKLNTIKEILIKAGLKDNEVSVINSKSNDEDVYNSIIELSKVPDHVKVILSTSILEVGTNIKNLDINIFVAIEKATHVNFNKIEQEVARFRVERNEECNNILKICIPSNDNEEKKHIKPLEIIEKDLENKCKKNVDWINQALECNEDKEKIAFIKGILSAPMSLYCVRDSVSFGIIEVDEENKVPVINKLKLRRKAKEIFEGQYFYNLDKFQEELENIIKTSIWLDVAYIDSERYKEEFKEVKEDKKALKKELKEIIINTFKEVQENGLEELFIDKILDPELNTFIEILEEGYKDLEGTKISRLTKQACNMKLQPKDIIQSFIDNSDSETKNKRQFTRLDYINLNNEYPIGSEITLKKIHYKDYVFCRNIFDEVCKKQGRVTNLKKLGLAIHLIENNVVKGYEIRNGSIYKQVKNKNDLAKKAKPLNKETIDKMVLPIMQTIYSLKDSNKQISALRTQY